MTSCVMPLSLAFGVHWSGDPRRGRSDRRPFRGRAPLVLPPKMELRAPAPGGGAEARNGNEAVEQAFARVRALVPSMERERFVSSG